MCEECELALEEYIWKLEEAGSEMLDLLIEVSETDGRGWWRALRPAEELQKLFPKD
jgi:hypothetical protein